LTLRRATVAELLIDCEEDRTLRAMLVRMLREPIASLLPLRSSTTSTTGNPCADERSLLVGRASCRPALEALRWPWRAELAPDRLSVLCEVLALVD
jgi:hypothetical protein